VASRSAADEQESIWPKLKVGKVGEFKDSQTKNYLKVRLVELASDKIFLAAIDENAPEFLVRGLPTKEYADDTVLELRGEWKVTGTGPYAKGGGFNEKTYFIVEPAPEARNKASLALAGEEKAPGIWPLMKVGKTGEFKDPKTGKVLEARLVSKITDNLMLVQLDKDRPRFLVKGLPTKDLADDSEVELKGEWKVTGIGPYAKSEFSTKKNYYIVEPVKK
jgi:hypothetical protein